MTYIQELSSLCTHLTFSIKSTFAAEGKSSDSPVGRKNLGPNKYIPWQETYLTRKVSKPLKKAAKTNLKASKMASTKQVIRVKMMIHSNRSRTSR